MAFKTIREKYGPAMEIMEQVAADEYFEVCVQDCMGFGKTREEAESIERQNLGYFAGYYDNDTRTRIEQLFRCSHPIFGKARKGTPTAEEALEAGKTLATQTEETPMTPSTDSESNG
ncbi:MAG: hypothetical protein V3W37_03000 [Candidatus Binatia bacterium]